MPMKFDNYRCVIDVWPKKVCCAAARKECCDQNQLIIDYEQNRKNEFGG